MKYLILFSLFALNAQASQTQSYECYVEDECPRNHTCAIPGLKINLIDGVYESATDVSHFDELEVTTAATYVNNLNLVGTQGPGLFLMQIDLNTLRANKKYTGYFTTYYGERNRVYCKKTSN